MQSESVTVKGIVNSITYQNADNGYTVFHVDVDGQEVTFVGTVPLLAEGEYICAQGTWTTHHTYGKQFSVISYQKELPATEQSILAYLSSGVIKGIGPVTAHRIVEKYGESTLSVIEEHPDWLSEIKGITPKRIKEISESFKSQYGMRQVMLYFQGMLSPLMSLKIYKRWGNASVDILRNNPYLLCDEIDGIGFEKADFIAQKMGFTRDSDERICSGIKYVLSLELSRNGNCCLPLDFLIDKSSQALGISTERINECLAFMSQDGDVVAVNDEKYGIMVYLQDTYRAEKYCAEKLLLLDEAALTVRAKNPDAEIARVEKQTGLKFAPLQKVAIKSSVTRGVVVITGGPGTGKTTLIRAMIELFETIGAQVCLAAPTGRAAKRITAATGREAKTIHRLLECEFGGEERVKFRRNEDNFLDEQVIIIDEASMVDVFLFCALLRAIRPGSRLVIIGDADQLSPVGAGDVFDHIIKSVAFMTVRLSDIFRQAQDSGIVTNAHLINEGRMPVLDNKKDFFFLKRNTSGDLTDLICTLCTQRLPKAYGFDSLCDIQIICPSRKGSAGTVAINATMQNLVNPAKKDLPSHTAHNVTFRKGDKVMVIHNNYDIEWIDENGTRGSGVFNGDIGFIEEIDSVSEVFAIKFDDGRLAGFDFSCFEDIEHAYAITVHKSQGSEYKAVVVPLFDCPPGLLSRNMLYTAVTRAEKIVILCGKQELVGDMVSNNRKNDKYSGLYRMLSAVKKRRDNERIDREEAEREQESE